MYGIQAPATMQIRTSACLTPQSVQRMLQHNAPTIKTTTETDGLIIPMTAVVLARKTTTKCTKLRPPPPLQRILMQGMQTHARDLPTASGIRQANDIAS